jgi:tetratricopeptide (TPR) repeat protein
MSSVVVLVLLLLGQDPADQLRRQELAFRLEELAGAGKLDGLAKAVIRELRGRRVDVSTFTLCWKILSNRRWDGKLEDFLQAWDQAAAIEAPAPAQSLFRARLSYLASKPQVQRAQLEDAAKKFPGEPAILWFLARARFDVADYAPAVQAMEDMAAHKGQPLDLDEYHRLLVRSYAETGRSSAAIEHLRALEGEFTDPADLAVFALRSRLPDEAARLFRVALLTDPDRLSLRMGLVKALGEDPEAAVERRRMFTVDGRLSPLKIEDYFFLLPSEGRAKEIARTLREMLGGGEELQSSLKLFESLIVTVPTEDRLPVSELWSKSTLDVPGWMVLARMRSAWGNSLEKTIETLDQGEKLFPDDPWFAREKIEPLKRLKQFTDLAAAYRRLVELDPEGKRTGPRPLATGQDAIRGLVEQKELPAALQLGVLMMSEPGMDEAALRDTRGAMRPVWEAAGPLLWEELRKLKLRAPDGKTVDAIRAGISRLGDDDFDVRSEASRELRKFGLPAIPKLLEVVDDKDIEVRSRAREIIRLILTD